MTVRALPLRGVRVLNFGVGGVAPWAASQGALAGDAMARTRAPRSASSWTTMLPTPPAAAETATVSPGFGSTALTAAHAVQPTT